MDFRTGSGVSPLPSVAYGVIGNPVSVLDLMLKESRRGAPAARSITAHASGTGARFKGVASSVAVGTAPDSHS